MLKKIVGIIGFAIVSGLIAWTILYRAGVVGTNATGRPPAVQTGTTVVPPARTAEGSDSLSSAKVPATDTPPVPDATPQTPEP